MAIVISAAIHSALFLPLCHPIIIKPDRPVIVDYIKVEESKRIMKQRATPEIQVVEKVKLAPSREAASDKTQAAKKEAHELAKKQAELRKTKDYINYYQLIRENIRKRLKDLYRTYKAEGDVCLVFTLNKDGSLTSVAADEGISVRNADLTRIAVESVREAAPFPPFPKELSVPKMSFDLTVSFKKS